MLQMQKKVHLCRDQEPQGKTKEEIEMNYHQFKHRGFLLFPRQTWTDFLRAKEDPNYEIDDIF